MDEETINIEEYLDAHPALSFALNQAMEGQAFRFHVFAANPERRVYRDWRDPEKRAVMERAYDKYVRGKKPFHLPE